MHVLFASHSPTLTTGYGRVTAVLAAAVHAAGHEVSVVGSGYLGEMHDRPYRMIPCPPDGLQTAVARALAPAALPGNGGHARGGGPRPPDVLLTVGDPWMFDRVPTMPGLDRVHWVAYFPVDGYPLPKAWSAWLARVDVPVVFSTFAQELVAETAAREPRLIYHGVDTNVFRPADKADAKARSGVAGKFVVGTVAANQQRKNIPALVKAFARFASDKADVALYLHTRYTGYWDVQELVARFGIERSTRATLNLDPQHGIPDERLATLYNAFDVFALPTMGEGFGLPIIESQACGVPALVTDFSACPELLPDRVQRLKVKDTLVMARNFEQAVVDVDDLVLKLETFYRDRPALESLGHRCRAFVTAKFEWQIAREQFVQLLAELKPKRQKP